MRSVALFSLLLLPLFGCRVPVSKSPPPAGQAMPRLPYVYRNVAVGGGGYVTGIVLHPKFPEMRYLRTDVGGAYRWESDQGVWRPLLDSLDRNNWQLYGVESLALHPDRPDTVYVALGKYLPRPWLSLPSALLVSRDGGQTFRKLGLSVAMGGNENFRWVGERLAIDPKKPSRIFFASRKDGLWKSEDDGEHFVRVDSFPVVGSDEVGLPFVQFDPQSGGPGKESRVIYVGAYGHGVYRSQDGGKTWHALSEGAIPKYPQRAALAPSGVLYVSAFGDGKIPGGIYKLDKDRFHNVTPDPRFDYCGISVSPADSQHLVTAPASDDFPTPVFRSTDGGASWKAISVQRKSEVPWWPDGFFTGHTSALVFDPHKPSRVFLTDYYGTWFTDDISAQPSQWRNLQRGHEEIEPFALRSPPTGAPLLSGNADVDGFRHEKLDSFPEKKLGGKDLHDGDVSGLDFCEADPNIVMRVGEERGGPFRGAVSADNGQTFSNFAALPFPTANGGRIVISARACQRALWLPKESVPYVTEDGGKTWTKSEGLPDQKGEYGNSDRWDYTQPLASDRLDSSRFYLLLNGRFFRSEDGGRHFSHVAKLPTLPFDPRAGHPGPSIKTQPGQAGSVFACIQQQGLWHSSDAGTTFRRLSAVSHCEIFALGMPAPGGPSATLFVYGSVNGSEGIFRSVDAGATFFRIDSAAQPIGDQAMVMEGDPRVFGRLYVGTNGRGIFYGEPMIETTLVETNPNGQR